MTQAARQTDDSDTQFWDNWKRCVPYIEAALERDGTHSIADVLKMVGQGEAIFAPVKNRQVFIRLSSTPPVFASGFGWPGAIWKNFKHWKRV